MTVERRPIALAPRHHEDWNTQEPIVPPGNLQRLPRRIFQYQDWHAAKANGPILRLPSHMPQRQMPAIPAVMALPGCLFFLSVTTASRDTATPPGRP